jgi:hypothetical protein
MSKTVTIRAQQKWEYTLETRKTEPTLLGVLNELGQQGWELVEVLHYKDIKGGLSWTAFLKRPSAGTGHPPGAQELAVTANSTTVLPAIEVPQPQGFDLSGDEFQLKTEHEPEVGEQE